MVGSYSEGYTHGVRSKPTAAITTDTPTSAANKIRRNYTSAVRLRPSQTQSTTTVSREPVLVCACACEIVIVRGGGGGEGGAGAGYRVGGNG